MVVSKICGERVVLGSYYLGDAIFLGPYQVPLIFGNSQNGFYSVGVPNSPK